MSNTSAHQSDSTRPAADPAANPATDRAADPAAAHLRDLIEFVVASPSSYHAADVVRRRLVAAGATVVDEAGPFPTGPGAYVVVRGGAVAAWRVPEALSDAAAPGFRIAGSHTDSPGFRLKPNPASWTLGYAQAAVEVYGGPLIGAWTDREIEFAGRVVTRDGAEHLARTGPIARIPQLAIHLNRGVNDQGLKLDKQAHTAPVVALADGPAGTGAIAAAIARSAGVDVADLVAWDLITCDTQEPRTFGIDGDFLASGRLDNLLSVHASLVAFEQLLAYDGTSGDSAGKTSAGDSATDIPATDIPVLVAFDHEEVGSASTTGAAGPFLEDILGRIVGAAVNATVNPTRGATAGATRGANPSGTDDGESGSVAPESESEARGRWFRRSSCLSVDGAHAVHPNYAGDHEPGHLPRLDGGPVVKVNANQRYATDAVTQALFERVTAAAGERIGETIPVQYFVSSNAKPCGSTIGPITATRLGIPTVDVGAAMLSMHSPREMCGVRDPWWLAEILRSYWSGH